MLKIKDNVDLKDLEKFGFKKYDWDYGYFYTKVICEGRRGQQFEIIVADNRTINGYSEGADGDGEVSCLDDTLYDLIEAGYVEKVEE